MSTGITIAKHFIPATVNVLSTMAFITPEAGTPYTKKDHNATGDVSAIVGITGHARGSIAVTFTQSCALALVHGMLGDDVQDVDQDTKDAVGEVTNMISGQARATLVQENLVFQGATPIVIMGNGHTICHVCKGPTIAIPFTTPHGEFTVEFCIDEGAPQS